MSDDMLHAILQMPPDLWSDKEIWQRHGRYCEASRRIIELESERNEARRERDEARNELETARRDLRVAKETFFQLKWSLDEIGVLVQQRTEAVLMSIREWK